MPDQGYHRSLPSEVFVPTASVVVEIVSPDDETWEKFDFYAAHQVEEICTAQPTEARLRWFRRDGSAYAESDQSHLLGVSVADLASGISWPR